MNYKSGAMIESERDELIAKRIYNASIGCEFGGAPTLSDMDFLIRQLQAERERSRILREACDDICSKRLTDIFIDEKLDGYGYAVKRCSEALAAAEKLSTNE